jgi:hypothetical protein
VHMEETATWSCSAWNAMSRILCHAPNVPRSSTVLTRSLVLPCSFFVCVFSTCCTHRRMSATHKRRKRAEGPQKQYFKTNFLCATLSRNPSCQETVLYVPPSLPSATLGPSYRLSFSKCLWSLTLSRVHVQGPRELERGT